MRKFIRKVKEFFKGLFRKELTNEEKGIEEILYDDKERVIYMRKTNGISYHWCYDDLGRITTYMDSAGIIHGYMYNKDGTYTVAVGDSYVATYDKNDNMIKKSIVKGNEYWYDEDGNIIRIKTPEGIEIECDRDGKLIKYMSMHGDIFEYDEYGNCTHCRKVSGFEYWKEYNYRGKLIGYKDTNGGTLYPDHV